MKEKSTAELLAEYADLLTKYGAGSEEELQFVRDREFDIEFSDLAKTAKLLKQAVESDDMVTYGELDDD